MIPVGVFSKDERKCKKILQAKSMLLVAVQKK